MLNDTEIDVIIGFVKRAALAAGLTLQGWNSTVLQFAGPDGTVDWAGVLQFVQGLIAMSPQIIALIMALLPLFGAIAPTTKETSR